ncbi:MAG: glycine/sarcosine/betaine reductase component B subunit [Gaiellaceae bacterium MAG52_C11]|nr:glycine/sarcosine/betaine reductase component B subunit [Candidatus Gaiellasilicea maunaloa]
MPAPLEIASYHCVDVRFGPAGSFRNGILELERERLRELARDEPPIVDVEITLVRPGDPVRLVNVLDVVEPTVKIDRPEATFPGSLGFDTKAGVGRTNRVDGLAIISMADFGPTRNATLLKDLPLAVIDMSGPAAPYSPWSKTRNVVVAYSFAAGASLEAAARTARRATLRIAQEIAEATRGAMPDDSLVLDDGTAEASDDLPAICVVLQLGAEGAVYDTFLYGQPINELEPRVLAPSEVLDGALVNQAFNWAAVRNPTYVYQRSRLLLALSGMHGKTLRFAGVVVGISYLESALDKERVARLAAEAAASLGADGAIVATFSSGYSHADAMLTCRACEAAGVRTAIIVAETDSGLFDHVEEADCIVSVGNIDEPAPQWQPEAIVAPPGSAAASELPSRLSIASYVGAAVQTGDAQLTMVPA